MKDLFNKIAGFFLSEDFAEYGDDAKPKLELTPSDLRMICNMHTENARLRRELEHIKKRPKGRWVYKGINGFGENVYGCSICGFNCYASDYHFCPNCSAEMMH